MSRFTGNIGREEEDGLGWEGLLPERKSNVTKVTKPHLTTVPVTPILKESTEEPNEIDATADTSWDDDWSDGDGPWKDAPEDNACFCDEDDGFDLWLGGM